MLALGWLALGVPLAVAGDEDRALNRWAITLEGDSRNPGRLIYNIAGEVSDLIRLEPMFPHSTPPGSALDARHLVIEFKVNGPLTKDVYVVVDYSADETIFVGSTNASTGRTFAKAVSVPDGYHLVNDDGLRQVQLRRFQRHR